METSFCKRFYVVIALLLLQLSFTTIVFSTQLPVCEKVKEESERTPALHSQCSCTQKELN